MENCLEQLAGGNYPSLVAWGQLDDDQTQHPHAGFISYLFYFVCLGVANQHYNAQILMGLPRKRYSIKNEVS